MRDVSRKVCFMLYVKVLGRELVVHAMEEWKTAKFPTAKYTWETAVSLEYYVVLLGIVSIQISRKKGRTHLS